MSLHSTENTTITNHNSVVKLKAHSIITPSTTVRIQKYLAKLNMWNGWMTDYWIVNWSWPVYKMWSLHLPIGTEKTMIKLKRFEPGTSQIQVTTYSQVAQFINVHSRQVKQSLYRSCQALGLCKVKAPRFQDNRHRPPLPHRK